MATSAGGALLDRMVTRVQRQSRASQVAPPDTTPASHAALPPGPKLGGPTGINTRHGATPRPVVPPTGTRPAPTAVAPGINRVRLGGAGALAGLIGRPGGYLAPLNPPMPRPAPGPDVTIPPGERPPVVPLPDVYGRPVPEPVPDHRQMPGPGTPRGYPGPRPVAPLQPQPYVAPQPVAQPQQPWWQARAAAMPQPVPVPPAPVAPVPGPAPVAQSQSTALSTLWRGDVAPVGPNQGGFGVFPDQARTTEAGVFNTQPQVVPQATVPVSPSPVATTPAPQPTWIPPYTEQGAWTHNPGLQIPGRYEQVPATTPTTPGTTPTTPGSTPTAPGTTSTVPTVTDPAALTWIKTNFPAASDAASVQAAYAAYVRTAQMVGAPTDTYTFDFWLNNQMTARRMQPASSLGSVASLMQQYLGMPVGQYLPQGGGPVQPNADLRGVVNRVAQESAQHRERAALSEAGSYKEVTNPTTGKTEYEWVRDPAAVAEQKRRLDRSQAQDNVSGVLAYENEVIDQYGNTGGRPVYGYRDLGGGQYEAIHDRNDPDIAAGKAYLNTDPNDGRLANGTAPNDYLNQPGGYTNVYNPATGTMQPKSNLPAPTYMYGNGTPYPDGDARGTAYLAGKQNQMPPPNSTGEMLLAWQDGIKASPGGMQPVSSNAGLAAQPAQREWEIWAQANEKSADAETRAWLAWARQNPEAADVQWMQFNQGVITELKPPAGWNRSPAAGRASTTSSGNTSSNSANSGSNGSGFSYTPDGSYSGPRGARMGGTTGSPDRVIEGERGTGPSNPRPGSGGAPPVVTRGSTKPKPKAKQQEKSTNPTNPQGSAWAPPPPRPMTTPRPEDTLGALGALIQWFIQTGKQAK